MSPSDEFIADCLFITCIKLPTVTAYEWYSYMGFRRWYIAFGIADCLNFAHRPVFTTQRFVIPQVRNGISCWVQLTVSLMCFDEKQGLMFLPEYWV